MHFDQLDQILDTEVGERHHRVVADPGDPYQAVFGLHLGGDVEQPILIFAEVRGRPD
jgi:hypothetical protein